ELERDGRPRTDEVTREVALLDLGGLGFETHPAGELVVEVLLAAAHAADIQRRVGADGVRTRLPVLADDHRHGGDDVEVVERAARLRSALPDLAELLPRVLRREEHR